MSEPCEDIEKGMLPPRYENIDECSSLDRLVNQASPLKENKQTAPIDPILTALPLESGQSSNFQTLSDQPPPYPDSFCQTMKGKWGQSQGRATSCTESLRNRFGLAGCTICAVLAAAIAISMIAIGHVYKEDCPRQKFIPIYLIVAGSIVAVKLIFCMIPGLLDKTNSCRDRGDKSDRLNSVVDLLLVLWFIIGSICIYRMAWYADFVTTPTGGDTPTEGATPTGNVMHTDSKYCHPVLFYYAISSITSIYVIILLTIVILTIAFCSGKC